MNDNNSTKKVLLNSSFYVFSALLVDAIGFLLLPVYLLFLDAAEYGKVSIANGFVDVVIILAELALHMAVGRFYAEYKNDKRKVAEYFGSVLTFVCITSISVSLLLLGGRELLVRYVFVGIDFYPVILLVIISIPFRALRYVHRSILRGIQCGRDLALANLLCFIVQAGLTLVFIGAMGMGAAGMLLAALIVHLAYVGFIYANLRSKKLLVLCFRWKLIVTSLQYSLPLLPHTLSNYIASLVSRVLLNNSFDTSAVGLYGVASQFGTLADTVEVSANNAFTPWFFNYKNANSADRDTIKSLIRLLSAAYGFCLLGVGLFSREAILLFMDVEYVAAWKVIPVIMVAYYIRAIYYFYINILLYYKQASRKLFIITVAGNLLNVVVSAALTPLIGMYGVASSLVVAQTVISISTYFLSRQYDKTSIVLKDIMAPLIISFVFMSAANLPSHLLFGDEMNWINFFAKALVLIAYIAIFIALNWNIVRSHLKKKRKKEILE